MNRITFFTICMLFICFNIKAQKMTFGCQSEITLIDQTFVSVLPNPEPFSPRISYDFGFLLNYKMSNILQIQIEPGFIEKGTQFNDEFYNERTNYKYGYLSNPIILIIKPIKRLGIELGPELNVLVYSKKRYFTGEIYTMDYQSCKKFDFAGIIGLNYSFFDNTSIYFRYVKSFIPLFDTSIIMDPGPSNGSYHYKIYNEYFAFGARYYFGKKEHVKN